MKKILPAFVIILLLFLFRFNLAFFVAKQNTSWLISYYEFLLKHKPNEAYKLFLENLDNKNTKIIATSYDNLNEMTVPEIMYFYSQKAGVFSKEQMQIVYDEIITNLDSRKHLIGVLSIYLIDNEKSPNLKYYPYIKKEIIRLVNTPNENNSIYFNYFINYNIPSDGILIKNYIKKAILEENQTYNFTLDNIINSPKQEYFPILKDYYYKKIIRKKYRSDKVYFELEQITKAFLQYKNIESKKILEEIAFNTQYYSQVDFVSNNEQIYLLLKEYDKSNYFSEITEKLSNKINKEHLQEIIDWNNKWKPKQLK